MNAIFDPENTFMQKTALHALHLEHGGNMVSFAGYELPIHYGDGILKEHLHVREKVGLFDVSHMGQALILPVSSENGELNHILKFNELIPNDIVDAPLNLCKYTALLNHNGCPIDDLIVTKIADTTGLEILWIVVNADQKNLDYMYIQEVLGDEGNLEILHDRALLALQGPMAEKTLSAFVPEIKNLKYMHGSPFDFDGIDVFISRTGYTGEDGFEISIPNDYAEEIARSLLEDKNVKLIGLGARDSLRLEAGYCLYGQDMDEEINLYEADLAWLINPRKLNQGEFSGAEKLQQLKDKDLNYKRAAMLIDGKLPARTGAVIFNEKNEKIGLVTSGLFSPSLDQPIAMGYITPQHTKIGTKIMIEVRGKKLKGKVVDLPFVKHNVKRNKTM
jgi:aminomethyltransferase